MKKSRFRLLAFQLALLATTHCLHSQDEEKPETVVAVHVAKVIRTSLTKTIVAYGIVEPAPATSSEPSAVVRLSPAMPGIISEANGVEGQAVKKGDVLFRLDSRATDEAVLKAEQAVEFAELNFTRQEALIKAESTSKKLVMEAEQTLSAAKAELASARVQQSLLVGEAPIAGTLVKFSASPGEAADATIVLAEIADLDRVVATVQIPRDEAASIKAGQKAGITVTDGKLVVESQVGFISSQVDPASGTVLVRLSLPKDAGLRIGEFVTARITIEEHGGVLAVPCESVYTAYDGTSTLSIIEGDTAKQKNVTVGLRDGELLEVSGDGVFEGATVVTLGSYALPEITKVRILETSASEEGK